MYNNVLQQSSVLLNLEMEYCIFTYILFLLFVPILQYCTDVVYCSRLFSAMPLRFVLSGLGERGGGLFGWFGIFVCLFVCLFDLFFILQFWTVDITLPVI